MKILLSTIVTRLVIATGARCHAASTHYGLTKGLRVAFSKGEFEATRTLAHICETLAELYFYCLDTVRKCASESTIMRTQGAIALAAAQDLNAKLE